MVHNKRKKLFSKEIPMKKRKMPVVLILIVFALLGFIGYTQLKSGPEGATPPPQPEQPKEEKSSVADTVTAHMNTPPTGPKSPPPGANRMMKGNNARNDTSSLLKVEQAPSKPVPNASSTTSQWYEHDAASNK